MLLWEHSNTVEAEAWLLVPVIPNPNLVVAGIPQGWPWVTHSTGYDSAGVNRGFPKLTAPYFRFCLQQRRGEVEER